MSIREQIARAVVYGLVFVVLPALMIFPEWLWNLIAGWL